MTQHDSQLLPPRKRVFVEQYCAGKGVTEAAAAAGVSQRQAYRWLREPAVQAAIRAHGTDALRRTAAVLTLSGRDAAETLVAALSAEHWPVRLKAAELLLDRLLKFHEVLNLEARIAALEEKLRERGDAAS
jgi:hypothetical protein